MTVILAVDPGLTRALAFYLSSAPDCIAVYDMPVVDGEVNPHELRDTNSRYQPSQAIIERVAPMPRDGVRQSWR